MLAGKTTTGFPGDERWQGNTRYRRGKGPTFVQLPRDNDRMVLYVGKTNNTGTEFFAGSCDDMESERERRCRSSKNRSEDH